MTKNATYCDKHVSSRKCIFFVVMVNKTTSFKRKGKGKKGNFEKNGKKVAAQVKKPKSRPKPETKCFYCKGTAH